MTEITNLQPQDRSRWAELWREYLQFYHTEMPDEVYDSTWQRILEDSALHGLAARAEGRIIGITHYLFHGSAWTIGPYCYLQDLFVDQSTRGHGAGRALIEAVAARARDHGSARLYWMTQDHNATARLLYDRLAKHNGFIRYDYALG